MLHAIVSQYRQTSRGTDTIIGTQGRTAGANPLTIDVSLNGVTGKIVRGICIRLRHHVDMRLQDHTFTVFKTRRGRFFQDQVTGRIDFDIDRL